jgi:hypothetical protein
MITEGESCPRYYPTPNRQPGDTPHIMTMPRPWLPAPVEVPVQISR